MALPLNRALGYRQELKKNYIVNGAMMVSQENGTAAGTVANYYPVDQFRVGVAGSTGVVSSQQVASPTPAGSPNRLRSTVTTADAAVAAGDFVGIVQEIEGYRIADLRSGSASAKTITIRFGCKGPAGTYCVSIRNSASNRAYVAEYTISAGEANTDVVKSVTIPLDQGGTWLVDNGIGFSVCWTLMCGTTFQTTAGAWAAGNFLASANQFNFMGTLSNVFELFDVGLYQGAVAPEFQVPDYPEELRKCQRYWEAGTQELFSINNLSGTVSAFGTIRFLTEKRTAPGITVSGWQYYSSGTPTAFTPTVNLVNTVKFDFTGTSLTNWTGWFNTGTWKASARM